MLTRDSPASKKSTMPSMCASPRTVIHIAVCTNGSLRQMLWSAHRHHHLRETAGIFPILVLKQEGGKNK